MALVPAARLLGEENAPFRTGVRFTAYGYAGSQLTPSGADPFFPRINSSGCLVAIVGVHTQQGKNCLLFSNYFGLPLINRFFLTQREENEPPSSIEK
jgi:hypothetical protein